MSAIEVVVYYTVEGGWGLRRPDPVYVELDTTPRCGVSGNPGSRGPGVTESASSVLRQSLGCWIRHTPHRRYHSSLRLLYLRFVVLWRGVASGEGVDRMASGGSEPRRQVRGRVTGKGVPEPTGRGPLTLPPPSTPPIGRREDLNPKGYTPRPTIVRSRPGETRSRR